MKPLKIACDIDGVVSDFAGPFLAFFNDRTDLIPVKMSEWVEWSLVDSLCLDDNRIRGQMQKEFDEAFRAYCDEDRFIHQPDIEAGWQMAQALLDGGHDIRYFTHRPPDNASHLYGGQPIVVCTDPEDKATKAAHWGADVFIDDRPENYLAARKAGIPLVILWATQYNKRFRERQGDKGDICNVAHNYDEVRALIDDHFVEEEDVVEYIKTQAEKHLGPWLGEEGAPNPLAVKFDAAMARLRGEPWDRVVAEMRDKLIRKNHDYAGGQDDPFANLRMCEACGLPAWQGVVVRLTDKNSRLQSFMLQGTLAVKDESVCDTFDDNAVYAILGRLLYEEGKNGQ